MVPLEYRLINRVICLLGDEDQDAREAARDALHRLFRQQVRLEASLSRGGDIHMAGKSNDQIAFGEVSDHDYLKALVLAGVLPATVVPGFPPEAVEIEGTGSSEPGADTAGRPLASGDPRRDETADEAVVEARAELRGDDDPQAKESSFNDRQLKDEAVEREEPVTVGVEDGGPPADAEGSATPDSTETADASSDPRTVEELQDELRAEGKPVSGTKAELIARLDEE